MPEVAKIVFGSNTARNVGSEILVVERGRNMEQHGPRDEEYTATMLVRRFHILSSGCGNFDFPFASKQSLVLWVCGGATSQLTSNRIAS